MFEGTLQLGIGFAIALSGALIPGPLLVYVLSESVSHGGKVGPLATVGHVLVELGIVALAFLGVALILQTSYYQALVGVVGGSLLLAFGLLSILKAKNVKVEKLNTPRFSFHPVVGGVLFSSVFNPTVPLWWSTVGFAMMMEAFVVAATAGVILWLAGHFLADFVWYSLISRFAGKRKDVIGGKTHKIITRIFSVLLIFFGVYFLAKYGLILLQV